jgi:hypothetical protein
MARGLGVAGKTLHRLEKTSEAVTGRGEDDEHGVLWSGA